MPNTVLVTGGAGFIGSHVSRQLLAEGARVRVLDNLLPQVHGDGGRPTYLDDEVELLVGDVRDPDDVAKALVGVDRVIHLCARVGVGQSMYEIVDYDSVNAVGTAVLLEALLQHPVERLVVASSMSIYGEGLYTDADGRPVAEAERRKQDVASGRWEPCDEQGRPLTPVPTPEWKRPALSSVYALTKYDQERLCVLFGDAYDVPVTALRFFNVYGPDQALSNPYTGVLAIFAARLLNDRRPLIFEDGEQRRDFVSVHDVARACTLALGSGRTGTDVVNVGSGQSASIREIAERFAAVVGKPHLEPEITGKYRVGDIRHCFADIGHARDVLGYEPTVSLEEGMTELAGWLEGQVAHDQVDDATAELAKRGLAV